MPGKHRLVTIAFSHYNEKARWALDFCGVDYVEHGFVPGFSHLGVYLATRGRGGRADEVSTKLSTPLLVTAEGERICDSTDIARWASERAGDRGKLFPEPAVLELVQRFSRGLGAATRLVAYWHVFRSETALDNLAKNNVGVVQALAFRALAPLVRGVIGKKLKVDDEHKDKAIASVRREIAFVEQRLDGRRYLVGDRFTAADLTFAALFSPALLVTRGEGFGATLCDPAELDAEARELVAEMRATRAGTFAIEMFEKHRRGRAGGVTS